MNTTFKNFIFLFFLIIVNDFLPQLKLSNGLWRVGAVKSFLDDFQSYELQMDVNSDQQISEYTPPIDEPILSEFIEEKAVIGEEEDKTSTSDDSQEKSEMASNEDLDDFDINDVLEMKDKKALKAKLKKMMNLLKDLSDDEENEDSDSTKKTKNLKKIQKKEENIEENLDEKSDDFSILDSPNSHFELRKNQNSKENKNNGGNGQGSVAKNRKGQWDNVKIFETSNWPELCKNGQQQSPIRIQLLSNYHIEPFRIDVDYHKPEEDFIELWNDGYKLFAKGSFGALQYGDHIFNVKEIHLHHPSEHTFGNDELRTDMELQIVNVDSSGLQMIVSVFLHNFKEKDNTADSDEELEKPIRFLRALLGVNEKINEDELGELDLINIGKKRQILNTEDLDLGLLLSQIENYITYYGSLTSPPCTEGVKWIIIRQKISITKFEIKAFQSVFGKESNVRGLQEIANREILMF